MLVSRGGGQDKHLRGCGGENENDVSASLMQPRERGLVGNNRTDGGIGVGRRRKEAFVCVCVETAPTPAKRRDKS